MFLTKKSVRKILIMAVCYFLLGSIWIVCSLLFVNLGLSAGFGWTLGVVTYLFGVLFVFWGRYAEGKGKFVNLGNKLVRNELKPAEFIK